MLTDHRPVSPCVFLKVGGWSKVRQLVQNRVTSCPSNTCLYVCSVEMAVEYMGILPKGNPIRKDSNPYSGVLLSELVNPASGSQKHPAKNPRFGD